METLTNCPVCQQSTFKQFLNCKDHLISNETFSIQQCINCGFRFTNPRPEAKNIGQYYKSAEYISHNDEGAGVIATVYRLVRSYTLSQKQQLIKNLNGKTGTVLDVGCGTGAFLQTCQEAGWDVTGTEPDTDAGRIASQKLKTEIWSDISLLDETKRFDVITLWHVLEHITNLTEAITKLYPLLNDQGTLVIAVPNSDSYDAQYYKSDWAAYDVPRHLYHFTPSTINTLFSTHGFKVVGQKPMLFDAFYIGLLSTRYQTGKTDYLKSIQIGLQSNRQAIKTGNASSNIYLLKKA